MTERRAARDRPLDERGDRVDVCPTCAGERQELPPHVVADRFYCERCKVATEGPNLRATAPAEIQLTLGLPSAHEDDRPPLDETAAWTTDGALRDEA